MECTYKMKIVSTKELEKGIITNFFITHWGSPQMVISSGIFQCDDLEGFAALNEKGNIIGFLTFNIDRDECEIISLDSLEEERGVGTTLIQRVENYAKENDCQRIKLVTTNDNLHALGFYQKRGYKLVGVFPHAVENARRVKPEIPLFAENGIPIRDEILLEKQL
jgi:ribosomal protein S18 acetylase RimI-like enzyme